MRISFVIGLFLFATASWAVEPDEILADPILETRAREISKGLRCVVCQNQDIDSSNAGVARDLRLIVRERLVAGDTDEMVVDFVRARYGDYVLMRPPFKPQTYALWLAPPAFALFAIGIGIVVVRRRRVQPAVQGLNPSEEAEVEAFLAQQNEGYDP